MGPIYSIDKYWKTLEQLKLNERIIKLDYKRFFIINILSVNEKLPVTPKHLTKDNI